MNDKEIKDFVKDRDKAVREACRTGNLENFKVFFENTKSLEFTSYYHCHQTRCSKSA